MNRMNRLVAIALFTISCGGEPATPTFEGAYETLFTLDENTCPLTFPDVVDETILFSALTEDERELQADLTTQNFSLHVVQEDGYFFGTGELLLPGYQVVVLASGTLTYETIEGDIVIFAFNQGFLNADLKKMTQEELLKLLENSFCSATYQFSGHKDE